jgi:hypothetical protein
MKPITPTEGFFLAYLWLIWAYTEQQRAAFMRAVFAMYDTPAFHKLHAVALAPSPLMRRLVKP